MEKDLRNLTEPLAHPRVFIGSPRLKVVHQYRTSKPLLLWHIKDRVYRVLIAPWVFSITSFQWTETLREHDWHDIKQTPLTFALYPDSAENEYLEASMHVLSVWVKKKLSLCKCNQVISHNSRQSLTTQLTGISENGQSHGRHMLLSSSSWHQVLMETWAWCVLSLTVIC